MAASEAQTSLERFLGAVDDRDYVAMGYLFGTQNGPVADTGGGLGCGFKRFGSWFGLGDPCGNWMDVELRMETIATILEHRGFDVMESRPVAGRSARTTRITIDLVRATDTVRAVPFEVVQSGGGQWYIEKIDLEKVTGR